MARPATLPDQAQAVDHVPTHLPAIPSEVTLPEAVGDHIIAAAEHIAPHVPDWFALAPAPTAAAQDHPPTEIPPPPPVDFALPLDATAHLTELPVAAHFPDWFLV